MHSHGEDEQPNESIRKRGVEAPPSVSRLRVPLPRVPQRLASGGSPSIPAALPTPGSSSSSRASGNLQPFERNRAEHQAWIWAKMSSGRSLVESLNSTYRLNDTPSQSDSTSPSPARLRRSSSQNTELKSPPNKRRRLSRTPSTSQGSSTQSLANGDSQQESGQNRRVPLYRKPKDRPTTLHPEASPRRTVSGTPPLVLEVAAAPAPMNAPTPSTDPKPAPSPTSQNVSRGTSANMPPPSATDIARSPPVSVKAEPPNDSLPSSLLHVRTTPHPPPTTAVKPELVESPIPNHTETPHASQEATSGTERVYPIPVSCRPGVQGWQDNRNKWMQNEVRSVKERGVSVRKVKLLPDGLIIDWERPSRPVSSTRLESAAAGGDAQVPATPPIHPSSQDMSTPVPTPISNPALQRSPTSVYADESPVVTPHPVNVEANFVPPASVIAPSPTPPAAAPARTARMSHMVTLARKLALKKKLQAQQHAEARRKMEEEALERQEEARKARGSPSPLLTTPPPPPDSPPRFRLDTPPPPWEVGNSEIGPPPGDLSVALASPPTGSGSPRSVSGSGSRGSTADVQRMVQPVEGESSDEDDDDLYLDPKDTPQRDASAVQSGQDWKGTDVRPDADLSDANIQAVPAQSEVHVSRPPSPRPVSAERTSTSAAPAASPLHNVPSAMLENQVTPSRDLISASRNTPPVAPAQTVLASISSPPALLAPSSLVVSATEEGVPAPVKEEREKLENDALEWLKQYIIAFDADRAALASAYSQHATFSMRCFSHVRDVPRPDATAPADVVVGTLAILSALLALPESFSFNVGDRRRPPTVEYDLVVAFDMIVYGTSADEGGPGIMVVCYVDPTGPVKAAGGEAGGERWVCEMQFVLRRRGWDEGSDGCVESGLNLVAVSHQMTMRRIPAGMSWNWR